MGFEADLGEGDVGCLREGFAGGKEGNGVEHGVVEAIERYDEPEAFYYEVARGKDLGLEVGGVGGVVFPSCC